MIACAVGQDSVLSFPKLQFLLGKWTGIATEKDSPHGSGQGAFSFLPEMNGKIIVRKNLADYSSGEHHEDLMIIYQDTPDSPARAIYFDSEGHVIHYNVTVPSTNNVTFESEASQPGPRYRLSYSLNGAALDGKFEVAPPGADYKTYLRWTSKKN